MLENYRVVVEKVSKLLKLNLIQSTELLNIPVAKLVGLSPFICGCSDPWRYAVANVVLFWIGGHEEVFKALPDDYDDYEHLDKRFWLLVNFPDGDKEKELHIRKLLALTSLCDMEHDVDIDEGFNPYKETISKVEGFKERVMTEVLSNDHVDIEKVYPIEEALRGFWRG